MPIDQSETFLHPFFGVDAASCLRERAALFGDSDFLIWAPFDAPAQTWTWARFEDETARLAGGLLRRGVTPGERIFIQLENCPETLLARFACAWIGAVAVLGNPRPHGRRDGRSCRGLRRARRHHPAAPAQRPGRLLGPRMDRRDRDRRGRAA